MLTLSQMSSFCLENGAILEVHLMHILQKLNGWGEEEGQSVCVYVITVIYKMLCFESLNLIQM